MLADHVVDGELGDAQVLLLVAFLDRVRQELGVVDFRDLGDDAKGLERVLDLGGKRGGSRSLQSVR